MKIHNLKFKFLIPALAIGALIGNVSVFAGSATSGGGDERCAQFYDLASEVALDLMTVGQAKITEVNPIINASLLWNKVRNQLRVLPSEHPLDRQAITDYQTAITQLDVLKWGVIENDQSKKLRLVAHELMVLMNWEGEGQYVVSNDLISILADSGKRLRKDFLMIKLEGKATNIYVNSKTQEVTIYSPTYSDSPEHSSNPFLYSATGSDMSGICMYLGFTSYIDTAASDPQSIMFYARADKNGIAETKQNRYYVNSHYVPSQFAELGSPPDLVTDETPISAIYVKSITCK